MHSPWMNRSALVFSLAVLISACGSAPARNNSVIFTGWNGLSLLRQCSRETPKGRIGLWRPDWTQIDALEAKLPRALLIAPKDTPIIQRPGESPQALNTTSPTLEFERRQYVGLVRDGRRYIYGNFFPKDPGTTEWLREPVLVCDGGADFFGVEYDVERGEFTHLAFNGYA